MIEPNPVSDEVRNLIRVQKEYYDEWAEGYSEWIAEYLKRYMTHLTTLTVGALRDHDNVLELAPGPGTFTAVISPVVGTLTAYDASPNMLEHLARLGLPNVKTELVDLFAWEPDTAPLYDAVFAANWVAHIPPNLVAAFFDKIARVLTPGGRVYIIDVDPRERFIERDAATVADVPVVLRTTGGQEFAIIKKYWPPKELLALLRDHGWRGSHVSIGADDERGIVFYTLERTEPS